MTPVIGATRDIALCRALRREVFTVEQGVSEADELDELVDEESDLSGGSSGFP